MVDLFNVILTIATVASAVIIGLTEGLRLTIGFRSSEETRNQKERTEGNLSKQVQTEVQEFITTCSKKEFSEKELSDKFEELGMKVYVSKNITGDILDNIVYFMERGLENAAMAFAILSIASLIPFLLDIFNLLNLLFFLAYVLIAFYFFRACAINIRKSYALRTELVKLNEDSTMENAIEIRGELLDRELLP